MEAEVFLLGRWKNYDELEDSLTIEELLTTIEAIRERENNQRKFDAAMQGIDLDAETERPRDITTLTGREAAKAGFGIGMGLGYEIQN